jgi:hypothetical protein
VGRASQHKVLFLIVARKILSFVQLEVLRKIFTVVVVVVVITKIQFDLLK